MSDFTEECAQAGGATDAARPTGTIVRRSFLDGLALARDAARTLKDRSQLSLAILVLATAGFFSRAFVEQRFGLASTSKPSSRQGGASFVERWMHPYASEPFSEALWQPAGYYAYPLEPSSAVAVWTKVPRAWACQRRIAQTWPSPALVVTGFLLTIPILLAYPLLLVALLCWVRDSSRPLRLSSWPGYWRHHYVPVLLVSLVWQGIWIPTTLIYVPLTNAIDGNAGSALGVLQDFVGGLLLAPIVLFLASFAIVGRHLGTKRGIVEGCRLLRRDWRALLALFAVYRIAYEALNLWKAVPPWPVYYNPVILSIGACPLLWLWAHDLGLAALGLWAAYAFIAIARQPAAGSEQ